jgi:hypothetical protein
MCWPVGFSRQCRIVSGSSSNQSLRSAGDQTPTLFTQPPRLVDEDTSGHRVTTRRAASGASRVRSSNARPSAACVVARPEGVRPMSVGSAGASTPCTGSRCSRAAVSAHTRPAGVSGAKRCQGASSDIPERSASSAICAADSSDEWFCGCPSLASPKPLTV